MLDFAAIDFERANAERCSVCSVGIVIVKDGEIVDKLCFASYGLTIVRDQLCQFYSLIQPEPDYYCYWNTRVHGLTQKDTMDAPVFPKVWEQVELQTINYTQSQHCVDMTSKLTNEARAE